VANATGCGDRAAIGGGRLLHAEMSDTRPHSPVVIDRVERSRGDGDTVTLRLAGQRLMAATAAELDALLVIDVHGRRHRFAASGADPGDPEAGGWEVRFAVPDWAVPVEYGQASIWVGASSVAVPPVGTKRRTAEPPPPGFESAQPPGFESAPARGFEPEPAAGFASEPRPGSSWAPPPPATVYGGVEAGRAGPLADALIRDTVSALHAELAQRSDRETALGVALDRARSELTARASSQAELEATHAALRAELARLTEAVAGQRAEFDRSLGEARERFESELAGERSQLADAARERDALRSELAGAEAETGRVRSEQERAAAELAQARVEQERAAAELAQARAEQERAAAELAQAQVEQERAAAELAQARAEQERGLSELAHTRAESDRGRAELAAAHEQQAGFEHTRQQLAEAGERLTAALQSERLRAQQASSLREQLAGAQISRDAAIAEAEGLRSELARIASELAVSRERPGAGGDELGDAHELLLQARALSTQLRQPGAE
jgi:hypothetical protein